MSVDEAIRRRRSVRGFLPDEVPEATIREVFELAQLAPSNCNVQPWTPHVVSGDGAAPAARRAGRRGHARSSRSSRTSSPTASSSASIASGRSTRRSNFTARWASSGAISSAARWPMSATTPVSTRRTRCSSSWTRLFGEREATDIGMYAQTLMLALTARGVASCAQGALSLFPDIVREHLGVPADQKLLFGVSFGYEDPVVKANAARVGRASLDDAVRFHR